MAFMIPETLRRRFSTQGTKKKVRALYWQEDYLDAYSQHTDLRVDEDPHDAIGGHWDEMGELQFRFLVDNGLKPEHRMLDIGCGTLRGGRHFIRYLDAGHYTGIDISKKVLAYGQELLVEEKLAEKRPKLVLNQEKRLRFSEFADQTFDYLLAQSVFTHLPPEYIEECFQHIRQIMGIDSRFFFTFYGSDEHCRRALKDFSQPWPFYQELAERHGYLIENKSEHYPHPSQQSMAVLTLA
ncbi:MAG: class I SAM-dependent methyltransferase [Alphaproteobacteria bacterium]|nr:class I SAM-dependent methyltransferase [Alphaproteobacteria bacterium]